MQKDINRSWFFRQPQQEVWDYLTKAELLEQWLMKNNFKPVVGHQFQFISDGLTDCEIAGVAYCQVLEVVPTSRLSYSWKYSMKGAEISTDSVVTWTLHEKNGGTELHLLHNGFTLMEDVISHTDGWVKNLNRLTELLNVPGHVHTNA